MVALGRLKRVPRLDGVDDLLLACQAQACLDALQGWLAGQVDPGRQTTGEVPTEDDDLLNSPDADQGRVHETDAGTDADRNPEEIILPSLEKEVMQANEILPIRLGREDEEPGPGG